MYDDYGSGSTRSPSANDQFAERLYNPLGEFSSYTYRITLYMLSPQQYSRYCAGDNGVVSSAAIVAQSGGINDSTEQRIEGIPYDLYIDNLTIKTITSTKESFIPSNSYDFSFQVYEPYGFSFSTQLVKAAMQFQQNNPNAKDVITALAQHYLLEIKFYGYDAMGNPISDAQGVYSRSFPIMITKFNFKLDNKVVVYNINAVLVHQQVAMGVKRGLVPPVLNLRADTVKHAIEGEKQTSGKPSKIRGLFQALNDHQEELKKSGQIDFPDEYKIRFEDAEIGESEIVGEWYLKDKAPMVPTKDAAGSNPKTANAQNAKKISKEIRTISITSGSSIISAIDQIISQSKYIEDAVSEHPREETQTVQRKSVKVDKEDGKTIHWYNITPHVEPGQWDEKRNDYQYTITYVVQKYDIPYVRSLYLKKAPAYPGPHKRYSYWFTGENTEILSYEQDYNLLYFQAAAMMSEVKTTKNSPNNNAPVTSQPAQGANPTNKLSGAFEIINSVKTFLYSPGDQVKARLKILGDPDYLMTSTGGAIDSIVKKRYGSDYSINPNSGQVFIEVDFKEGVDYQHTDGLLEVNDSITFWDYPDSMKSKVKGMAYMVIQATSNFNKGLFTQDLRLILPPFKEPTGGDSSSDAEEGRESSEQSPSVDNAEGPNLSEGREPGSSSGPSFNDTSGSKIKEGDPSSSPSTSKTTENPVTSTESRKTLTSPPVTKRSAPTNTGSQVQDDDGSYDKNEVQRLKARAEANKTPPSAPQREEPETKTQTQPAPRNPNAKPQLKLRENKGETWSLQSFRVFDPASYKKD